MIRRTIAVIVLAGVYLLVLPSWDPWDIAIGLILATILIVSFRSYYGRADDLAAPAFTERLLWLIPFVLSVIWDVTTGSIRVAAMVLRLRPLAQPRFIEIPVDDYTLNGATLNALVTTLSPGSVLVDIDWSRRVMLLHVLDDAKPEEIRAAFRARYDNYQRHVVP